MHHCAVAYSAPCSEALEPRYKAIPQARIEAKGEGGGGGQTNHRSRALFHKTSNSIIGYPRLVYSWVANTGHIIQVCKVAIFKKLSASVLLVVQPPATNNSPSGRTAQAHSHRAVGKSPTLTQLLLLHVGT